MGKLDKSCSTRRSTAKMYAVSLVSSIPITYVGAGYPTIRLRSRLLTLTDRDLDREVTGLAVVFTWTKKKADLAVRPTSSTRKSSVAFFSPRK